METWTTNLAHRACSAAMLLQKVGKGKLLSWESKSSSNVRVDVWVVNQWWIQMIFRRKFSVPKFAVLARSEQLILIPVTVKSWYVLIRLFGLRSPKRFVVAFCDVGPMFPCNKSHEAMKNCWDWVFSHSGSEAGCQPFSCPSSKNVRHCRKEIYGTCLLQESMPFVKSKPPLPTRSLRFLRAAVDFTSSTLWLHHAGKR